MIGVENLWMTYGWWGFLGYVVVKEILPFFRDKVWPEKIKERDAERLRLQRLEERAILAEERQAKAIESMSLSSQQMALAITTENERISQMIVAQNEHARFTVDAIGDMRETVASLHAQEKGSKK